MNSRLSPPSVRTKLDENAFTLIEILVVISIVAILASLIFATVGGMQERAAAAKCLSNMKSVVVASNLFASDNDGKLPPLYTAKAIFPQQAAESNPVAIGAGVLAWPDILSLYGCEAAHVSCPALHKPATPGDGGISSVRSSLGIGINFPSLASVWVTPAAFERQVRVGKPSKTVYFADAGGGPNSTGPFDKREDTPGRGSTFFRGARDEGANVMPRHSGKANVVFVDGHALAVDPNDIDWGPRNPSFTDAVGWSDATAER